MKPKVNQVISPLTHANIVRLDVVHRTHQEPKTDLAKSKLVVQSHDGIQLISFDRILYVKAEGSYARIVVDDGSILISKSLKRLADNSLPTSFARCHQSYVVNLLRINQVRTKECMDVILDNGDEIPVSRRQVAMLKKSIHTFFQS